MIEAFRKIWRFAGNETKNINKSVAVGFLNALLQMFRWRRFTLWFSR